MRRFAVVAVGLAIVAAVFAPASGAQTTRDATIDFTDAGQGPVTRDFFFPLGVALTDDAFVSLIQGDEAVQGPWSGTFNAPVSALAARVVPAFAGFSNVVATGRITLTARDAGGAVVASKSIEPTTDTAAGTGLVYLTIDLGALPSPAASFRLPVVDSMSRRPTTASLAPLLTPPVSTSSLRANSASPLSSRQQTRLPR